MPEIHVVNGTPRECSDAITARGLIHEWLKDPDGTEAKLAKTLDAEAASRAASPRPAKTADRALNYTASTEPISGSPPARPPRARAPEKEE